MHWRSISRDNILTLYGKDQNSRIYDPNDPTHIFSWMICETRDDKGNAILYEYVEEDGTGVDLSQVHERNRGPADSPLRNANRYLKRIRYGNRTTLLRFSPVEENYRRPAFLTPAEINTMEWMFEVVFDFEEGRLGEIETDDLGRQFVTARMESATGWQVRQDPISSYRAGFEVRTYRLCRRVMMFHHSLMNSSSKTA